MTALRTRVLLATMALSGIGAGIFFAAPDVHADTSDDAFLRTIQQMGINYGSRDLAIQAGHDICSSRAKGYTSIAIADSIERVTNLDDFSAGVVVGAAEGAYCPAYSGNGSIV